MSSTRFPVSASTNARFTAVQVFPSAGRDEVMASLRVSWLADANRKGDGNMRFEVVQQTSRPNHFTVIEAWKDHKAYDARGSAGSQRSFRDKLGPMLGALYDERIYRAVD